MVDCISPSEISDVYRQSQELNLLDSEDTAVVFYSLDALDDRLHHLKTVFPVHVRHAIAIKTNPEKAVLKHIIDAGFGLEAASIEELRRAIDCGLSPRKAVFDSPAKTRSEISWCEKHCPGMVVNANCLEELERYSPNSGLRIGLRINPETEVDAPAIFNVGGMESKFGVPISQRDEILKSSLEAPYIEGLHIHAGSDIGDFTPNIQAICRIVALADEINALRAEKGIHNKIEFVDIGGGIRASRDESGTNSGLRPFAEELNRACPQLFTKYEVITEFGRFIHSDNAFVVSDVEYVLPANETNPKTAILHVGADMFVRQAYSAMKTAYPLTAMDGRGVLKSGEASAHFDVAGPLCFAGDYIFRNRDMEDIRSGDKLAISNVGANTTALWSRHCGRNIPKLIAYSRRTNSFLIAHPRKSASAL